MAHTFTVDGINKAWLPIKVTCASAIGARRGDHMVAKKGTFDASKIVFFYLVEKERSTIMVSLEDAIALREHLTVLIDAVED